MAQKNWVCWGFGRPARPDSGVQQGRTGRGKAGNSGGISLAQPHSRE